jgi:hypothetical protein
MTDGQTLTWWYVKLKPSLWIRRVRRDVHTALPEVRAANTHHCHQCWPHLVDPHVVAGATKSMNYDLGRSGKVEGFTGPRPDRTQVTEREVHDRRVGSRAARVQKEPGVHLVGWGRQHVQVAERPGVLEATHLGVADGRVLALTPAKELKHLYTEWSVEV